MAIIYPAICRNTTAGALRQVKQHGMTTASGGLFLPDFIDSVARTDFKSFFLKHEPAGQFMSELESKAEAIDKTTEAIMSASRRMVETARDSSKQLADSTGKMRATTEHLGVAIDKLMKVAGRPDFATTVTLTESLVASLERLAVLEEKGLLDKVMKAMRPA